MAGAAELAAQGVHSSLQPQNLRIRHAVDDASGLARHASYPLIFDPQTAGGLLAGIPAGNAQNCLAELRDAGYAQAAIIGRVAEGGTAGSAIRLVDA
jgi:selenide,water dikinase